LKIQTQELRATTYSPDCHSFPRWSAQISLGLSDSYITSNPFTCGLLIAPMMEAVHTFETSIYSEITWHYIPEGSNLQEEQKIIP
jgi:hypothetical protein